MASYKLTDRAERDLTRIYKRGIKEYGLFQANLYYDKLIENFEEIARNPYLFQSFDHIKEGYRRSVCGSDNIYYRISGDVIEIISILGRQDTDNL